MNAKSYLIAALIALALVVWMGSGYLMRSGEGSVGDAPATEPVREPMTVQVRRQQAEPVTRRLESQGDAEPDRQVLVRAETTGRIEEILVAKGDRVEAGDPLARIAMNDRQARLRQAEARVAQREADYEAASRLGDSGYQAEAQVREVRAALETARAELEAIREDIDNTVLHAPFAGVLNDRMIEVGDYVGPGDPVAQVIDNDPLKVVVNIAQQDIRRVSPGTRAEVELTTGETLRGRVTYVAAAAQPQTRTFRVELSVDNPGGLPAGVSATVRIPLETLEAHLISPALLSLGEQGELGVKTVEEGNRAAFHPVEVLRAENKGVWVTGLPHTATLITVGQGFVRPGEPVNTVFAGSEDAIDAVPDVPLWSDEPQGARGGS